MFIRKEPHTVPISGNGTMPSRWTPNTNLVNISLSSNILQIIEFVSYGTPNRSFLTDNRNCFPLSGNVIGNRIKGPINTEASDQLNL